VALLSIGLLTQAAVGPADRALAMLEQGGVVARIYAISFVLNVALGLVLIPALGLAGAALATSLALTGKSALLFITVRKRLGLNMFAFKAGAEQRRGTTVVSPDHLSAELLTLDEARPLLAAWRTLAERSVEPNVFYEPAFALAGMTHLPEGSRARLLVAWRGMAPSRRLVGVLPLMPGRGRYLNPLPVRRATEFYGTLSTPLLDRDRPEEVLRAMLTALDRAGISALLLPFLHEHGEVAAALERVRAEAGLKWVRFEGHQRPMLQCDLPGEGYARARLDPGRRRKLERQRRRLAEQGALAFTVAQNEEEVATALDAFFDLEASGWKGRLGTALRHSPGAVAFVRGLALAMAREGTFRVASLTLDGRPVASGLIAIAGRRAFYVKIAFDESLARLSPGILHLLDLTAHLLDDPDIDATDSIAIADHPLYRGIWFERMPIASVMVSTRPGGGLMFEAGVTVERAREFLRRELKPLRAKAIARIKGARGTSAADVTAAEPPS
jgi:CelD/BcsL family acetyltransferase involved in cellulose biosynthesis